MAAFSQYMYTSLLKANNMDLLHVNARYDDAPRQASYDLTFLVVAIFVFLLARYIWLDEERRATMNKIFNKAKSAFSHDDSVFPGSGPQQQQAPLVDNPLAIQAPTSLDVTRYRYHHGVNLGSVFILEKWLTGSMFVDSAKGSSELAAVEARIKAEGVDKARQRHEQHWREYVSDGDLDWLRDVGKCTTVRLPIGYFTLGPPYCEGTAFKHVSEVYQNAWPAVKELVGRCHQRGIGVLIDMHGLPGGANAQDHSGTNSGKAEFWETRSSRERALLCLCFIAQQIRNVEGVAGLQIINEAEWNAKGMYDWYELVLRELGKVDPTLPVYISDAWDLNHATLWSQGRNKIGMQQSNPVVIDTHLYWCFSDADKKTPPQQIAQAAAKKLWELDGKDGNVIDRGAAQAVVGEYSCVLGEESWAAGGGAPKEDLVRGFGNAQSSRYQQRAGGSFFWTYRMDWMPGGEWGFKQMTEQHAIVPPQSLMLSTQDVQQRIGHAQSQQQQRKQGAFSSHCGYWDSNHPGEYEHWRFERGWDVGYGDAMAFFGMRGRSNLQGADKIGMLDLWCLKRLRDSGQGGRFVWEFEQGMRQGMKAFYECVGV